MNERENTLARIREALTVPAAAHHGRGLPKVAEQQRVLPAVGATLAEQLALFAKHAADLKATFRIVADAAELAAHLRQLRDAEGWKRAAAHRGALVEAAVAKLDLPLQYTDEGYDPHELEKCDVGISECDALVAQTGSVLVTARSAGGRALSCLPPHHVVLARRDQMVADLPAAFALIQSRYGADFPSMISFITGPSRTGDIERILVLGAHGPKRLTIFCE